MIIDTHGHLVPPDLLAAIRKDGPKLPSLKIIDNDAGLALAFGNAKPTRPAMKGLSDVAGRLAWMQKQGIDAQVNGGWPDWLGNDLPAADGETWCRMVNEALLSTARSEPKFVMLAALPMQDGARAAAVLKAAMAQGFRGAMISTLPRGIGSVLDAPDLDPFWKAADDTGAVIHIHPAFEAGESRVHDYGLANGVGRVSDALVAVSRLAMSGHVTRYRNAKIFVPIAAGGLPIVLGRLKRTHDITPGTSDPVEALSLLYTDTIEHDPRVLRFVIEMMGADRVMLGSDMPFPIGDHEPMTIVAKAGLKPDQVAAINGGTAQKLFRIS
ncbi:MAG: amidohydrolase [Xanthobacteraceae bacterium]|nr:amidohydrolase [Xanthobacteraceae bacterium]